MRPLALRLLAAALTFALGVAATTLAARLLTPAEELPMPEPEYPSGCLIFSLRLGPTAQSCHLHGVPMRREQVTTGYAVRIVSHRHSKEAGKAENFPNCHLLETPIKLYGADAPREPASAALMLTCPECAAAEKAWEKRARK